VTQPIGEAVTARQPAASGSQQLSTSPYIIHHRAHSAGTSAAGRPGPQPGQATSPTQEGQNRAGSERLLPVLSSESSPRNPCFWRQEHGSNNPRRGNEPSKPESQVPGRWHRPPAPRTERDGRRGGSSPAQGGLPSKSKGASLCLGPRLGENSHTAARQRGLDSSPMHPGSERLLRRHHGGWLRNKARTGERSKVTKGCLQLPAPEALSGRLRTKRLPWPCIPAGRGSCAEERR
jgi:hypothetical protein